MLITSLRRLLHKYGPDEKEFAKIYSLCYGANDKLIVADNSGGFRGVARGAVAPPPLPAISGNVKE